MTARSMDPSSTLSIALLSIQLADNLHRTPRPLRDELTTNFLSDPRALTTVKYPIFSLASMTSAALLYFFIIEP